MDAFSFPFLASCTSVIADQGDMFVGLWLAGLGGSFTHCTGMCGPFVLSQTTARLQTIPATAMHEMHRITGPLLIPYHLGRMTTYMFLGGTAATLTGTLQTYMVLPWISALLMTLSGCFFLMQALPQVKAALPGWPGGLSFAIVPFNTSSDFVRTLLSAPIGWRGYTLGVILGFLPCGMLYGAVAAAAATANPLAGMAGMCVFTLGTLPGLIAVGYTGHIVGTIWKRIPPVYGALLMGVNALFLFWLAGQVIL